MVRTPFLLLLVVASGAACYRPRPSMSPRDCPAIARGAPGPLDTLVHDPPYLTVRPRRGLSPPVRYPTDERLAGIGGEVVVEVVVDPLGHPEPASVRIASATDSAFVNPAVQVVLATRFCPGLIKGHPVRTRVRVPITFNVGPR